MSKGILHRVVHRIVERRFDRMRDVALLKVVDDPLHLVRFALKSKLVLKGFDL